MSRFAVIGSPVAHSRSPAMHAAAYRALGMDHTYEKLETAAAELPARVDALRRGALDGLNVTVPHKTAVIALVEEVDASAKATGAANTLVRTASGALRAYNTDAPALATELERLLGRPRSDLAGRTAIVLGTGGAARAAVFALGNLGIAKIIVRGRREVDLAGASAARLAFEPFVAPANEAHDLVAIVQATTSGMTGAAAGDIAASAVAWASVPSDAVALDVVYAPPRTPFLDRAAARGLANDNGLGMLVGQGALAFELWLGVAPPRDVMRAALAMR